MTTTLYYSGHIEPSSSPTHSDALPLLLFHLLFLSVSTTHTGCYTGSRLRSRSAEQDK